MSPEVETAAQDALDAIDCELRSIEQSEESEEDWDEIRDAWRAVALALLTAARMDCNQRYFELLLESLSAFCDDSNEVAHPSTPGALSMGAIFYGPRVSTAPTR